MIQKYNFNFESLVFIPINLNKCIFNLDVYSFEELRQINPTINLHFS